MVDLKRRGIKSFLAGSGSSTDISGLDVAHLAVAANPELMQLSPGPGIDTPHAIAVNEIQRVLTLIQARREGIIR